MTTLTLILDFLLSSFTSYNLHLVVLGVLFARTFRPILIYFLILTMSEPRYLFNLVALYGLYKLNGWIDSRVRKTNITFALKIVLFYTIYVLFLKILRNII